MKRTLRCSLIGICLLVTACGYHLRGAIEMPEAMKKMYVFGASAELNTQLQSIVKSSKGTITGSPNEAGVVVKVLREDMRRRTLSIGSTGKSSEAELDYYLRFQIYDNQENPLMDEQTIEMSREYFNDQTAILAKSNEEQLIRSEMYKQVARMLLARARIAVDTPKK